MTSRLTAPLFAAALLTTAADAQLAASHGTLPPSQDATAWAASATPTGYSLRPGWPVIVQGSSVDGGLLADLDGDGGQELIQVAGDSGGGSIWIFDDDGTVLTQKFIDYGTFSAPALGDVDGDGEPEIVVESFFFGIDSFLYAIELDGTDLPGFPLNIGGGLKAPALADLDGDGDLEILSAVNVGGIGRVYAIDGDGSVLPGWPQVLDSVVGSSPSVGDLDGDGVPEIVAVSFEKLYVFAPDGTLRPGFPFTPGTNLTFNYNSISLADLDGDGDREMITAVSLEFGLEGRVYVLNDDGTVASGWPQFTPNPIFAPPAVADLDGDNALDVIIGDQFLSPVPVDFVHAWDANGVPLPGFPVGPIDAVLSQATIADVDGDGGFEIMVDDNVADSAFVGIDTDGSFLSGWPLDVSGSAFQQMLNVGDVDGNGLIDLVGSGNRQNQNETWIAMWEAKRAWDPALAPVSTYMYGPERSGVVPDPVAIGSWAEVGVGLAGASGTPDLEVTGALRGDDTLIAALCDALPGGAANLVIGLTQLSAPFKGGVLVPKPDVILGGLPISASGDLVLFGVWPSGFPAGFDVLFQVWIADGSGPAGFTSSQGVRGTTP